MWRILPAWDASHMKNNYQLLGEVEQNIVICRWRADQLFADAEGRGYLSVLILAFCTPFFLSFFRLSFCTHFPKVQQSESPLFTRLRPTRMLRVLFVAEERF